MKKYFFLALLVFIVCAGQSVFAQENITTEMEESEFIAFAHIGVHSPLIFLEETGDYKMEFTIANEDDFVQPQLRYGVQLAQAQGDAYAILDHVVYDDVISLGPLDQKEVVVDYRVPETLPAGEYELLIEVSNDRGIVYNNSLAGTVTVKKDDSSGIIIDEYSCKVKVDGVDQDFNIAYGVDIEPSDQIFLYCNFENISTDVQEFTPVFKTSERSIYGEHVSTDYLAKETIQSNQKKEFKFPVPTQDVPQSYALEFFLINDNHAKISNTVYPQYVIRGESATVQMVTFDKGVYEAGETANIKLLITPSADQFPTARGEEENYTQDVFVNLEITDKNDKICGRIDHLLVEQQKFLVDGVDVQINEKCVGPIINVSAKNTSGDVLDDNKFAHTDVVEEKGIKNTALFSSSFKVILVLTIVLILGIIIFQSIKKNKNRSIGVMVFIFLGLSLLVGQADAATSTSGTFSHASGVQQWPIKNTANANVSNYRTTSGGTAVYYPGDTLKTSGSMTMNYCNNRNVTVNATWQYKSGASSAGFIGSKICWASGHGNIACTNSSGTKSHAVPGVGNYNTYYKYKYHAGTDGQDRDGNLSLPYKVVNSPVNGACGTRNGQNYAWDATWWTSGSTWCSRGTFQDIAGGSFPVQGGSKTWRCLGSNGGSNSGTCTATRKSPPVAACGTRHQQNYAWDASGWDTGTTWCASGTRSGGSTFPVYGGQTDWECTISGDPTPEPCYATRDNSPIPTCNTTRAKTYAWDATGWAGTSFCVNGTVINPIPEFPSHGQTKTWKCLGLNGISESGNCTANRENPPACTCSSNANLNYSYLTAAPIAPLCNAGTPTGTTIFPSGAYGNSSFISWTCDNTAATPCLGISGNCEAQRGAPQLCDCGTADGGTVSASPNGVAACSNGDKSNEQSNSAGWTWDCGTTNDNDGTGGICIANHPDDQCSASCVKVDIDAPSTVYLKKGGNKIKAQVRVTGTVENGASCTITLLSGSAVIDSVDTTLNGNSTLEIELEGYSGASMEITASCELRVDCAGGSSWSNVKTYTADPHTIQSVCMQKSCNAQGTCQKNPIGASNYNDSQCTSTCNSNADCSSGRIIETKP